MHECALHERIDHFLAQKADYQINGTWIYKVHQGMADQFYKGNVVLLGMQPTLITKWEAWG